MWRIQATLLVLLLAVLPVLAQESDHASENQGHGNSAQAAPQGNAPRGVRVRWYDVINDAPVESDRQMIEWGATGREVEASLGEDHYADWKGEDAWVLGTAKYGGWWADFGDDAPRAYPTTLFFIDGKFFRYFVDVQPERFELVETTLTKALGAPDNRESSTVQNRMGAEYDQEIRIWEFEEVDVHLVKRAGKVTAGLLAVTYKPLAREVPEETAEAPF